MVLYADILFLVDLSMDWLTLVLCARLTHRPTTGRRLLAAAVLGASGSVLLVVTEAGRAVTFLTGNLLAAGMTAAAFGFCRQEGRWKPFVRQWLTVWGCGAVTGGVLSVLMSLGQPVYMGTETAGEEGFLPLFLATAAVIFGLLRLLQRHCHSMRTEITVRWQGREAAFYALVDTGNLLWEPMTGRPVILVSAEAVSSLQLPTGEGPTDTAMLFPIIAKGSTGTRLLWGVKPEGLTVGGRPKEALLAAEQVPAGHYGGCGGTCPGCLAE